MKGTPEEYTRAFHAFLDCTDEKKVFLEKIGEKLRDHNVSSVLDIGAGNGDLAIPLSKLVDTYVAIEPVSQQADILRKAGLTVFESLFPCPINENFDLVLISHSLPWKQEKYQPFLTEAKKLVAANGSILVITYDDSTGDWHKLLVECGLPSKRRITNHVSALIEFLPSLSPRITRTDIITTVASTDLEKVMRALAFVYSDGEPDHFAEFMSSEKVRSYIRDRYHDPLKGFSFPFAHIFLEMKI